MLPAQAVLWIWIAHCRDGNIRLNKATSDFSKYHRVECNGRDVFGTDLCPATIALMSTQATGEVRRQASRVMRRRIRTGDQAMERKLLQIAFGLAGLAAVGFGLAGLPVDTTLTGLSDDVVIDAIT
jgi:hypothetical protein